jgi:natural product precursor
MEKKIKLTELSKEELRSVSGGFTAGAKCNCDCSGNKQTFGQQDSASGGIKKPISPITRPK